MATDYIDYWACSGKTPFETYDLARRQIAKRTKRIGRRVKAFQQEKLVIYRCRLCHHWHLGNGSIRKL